MFQLRLGLHQAGLRGAHLRLRVDYLTRRTAAQLALRVSGLL